MRKEFQEEGIIKGKVKKYNIGRLVVQQNWSIKCEDRKIGWVRIGKQDGVEKQNRGLNFGGFSYYFKVFVFYFKRIRDLLKV